MSNRRPTVFGAIVILWLGGATVGLAQSEVPRSASAAPASSTTARDTTGESRNENRRGTWVDRLQELESDDPQPFRPLLGVIVPGSGLAAGIAVASPRLGRGWGVDADSMISVRNYHHLALRIGLLGERQALPLLRPFEHSLWSLVDEGRDLARGTAVFVETRYRRLPRLELFGDAPEGVQRTDYGQRLWTADVVAQWQAGRRVGLSARAGVMSAGLFSGTNDSRVDTAAAFASELNLSRINDVRYTVAGAAAVVDARNDRQQPSRGVLIAASSWIFAPATEGLTPFVRATADVRGYRGLSTRHVLAARLLAAADAGARLDDTPFFLMPTLGGSTTMRSFPSYRFRGTRLVTASVESRWDVMTALELAPFVDLGRIGRPAIGHDAAGLLTSVGLSVRAKWRRRVLARTDLAHGRDGVRLSVAFDFDRSF